MTTKEITPQNRLTVLKHLASGKGPDVVATITRLDRAAVVDIGNHHGYPDQAAADRVLDHVGKLRDLIREDQEKNAEKRQREAEKTAARAEVERLERQLAAAKAKLRGKPAPSTASSSAGIDEPTRRKLPKSDRTCDDCGQTLHTTEAGMRMHRMRVHPRAS